MLGGSEQLVVAVPVVVALEEWAAATVDGRLFYVGAGKQKVRRVIALALDEVVNSDYPDAVDHRFLGGLEPTWLRLQIIRCGEDKGLPSQAHPGIDLCGVAPTAKVDLNSQALASQLAFDRLVLGSIVGVGKKQDSGRWR